MQNAPLRVIFQNSVTYRPGCYVAVGFENMMPSFARVDSIQSCAGEPIFICNCMETMRFKEHLRCYEIHWQLYQKGILSSGTTGLSPTSCTLHILYKLMLMHTFTYNRILKMSMMLHFYARFYCRINNNMLHCNYDNLGNCFSNNELLF